MESFFDIQRTCYNRATSSAVSFIKRATMAEIMMGEIATAATVTVDPMKLQKPKLTAMRVLRLKGETMKEERQ